MFLRWDLNSWDQIFVIVLIVHSFGWCACSFWVWLFSSPFEVSSFITGLSSVAKSLVTGVQRNKRTVQRSTGSRSVARGATTMMDSLAVCIKDNAHSKPPPILLERRLCCSECLLHCYQTCVRFSAWTAGSSQLCVTPVTAHATSTSHLTCELRSTENGAQIFWRSVPLPC